MILYLHGAMPSFKIHSSWSVSGLITILILISGHASAQKWVDTLYTIQTTYDVVYGQDTGFAGRLDTLKLDISIPQNDTPSACGRPLLVVVHGGAWVAGDKNDGYAKRLREDFAKRGYVTASVNYRMGYFNTEKAVNCNVSGWNCFNATDSSEWYRANYRGMQDVRGAIRYLVNTKSTYSIDPNHVYLVGESAGGFIALSTGYLDDPSEVMTGLSAAMPSAPKPNAIYDNPCVQKYNMASNIASMSLTRPNLGSYIGRLNQPLKDSVRIRAVGSIFGGSFNNLFETFQSPAPALYLYHQPCDLIVPYNHDRLLAGFNSCMMQFPTNCGTIINRPGCYGGKGIADLIDTLAAQGKPTITYLFDRSTNGYGCAEQALDPSKVCHAIDNYWLRTKNMAAFFSEQMDSCAIGAILSMQVQTLSIYPNPSSDIVTIDWEQKSEFEELTVLDVNGRSHFPTITQHNNTLHVSLHALHAGMYFVRIQSHGTIWMGKFVKN